MNMNIENNELIKDQDIDVKILIKLKNINTNLFKTLNDYLKEIDNLKKSNEDINSNQNQKPHLNLIVKKMLEKNIYYSRNGNFDMLGCMINMFLKDVEYAIDELCDHEIEEDDIDLGPETSKRIYYCKKCEKTF